MSFASEFCGLSPVISSLWIRWMKIQKLLKELMFQKAEEEIFLVLTETETKVVSLILQFTSHQQT